MFNRNYLAVSAMAQKVASTVTVEGTAVDLAGYLSVARREVKFVIGYVDYISTATTTTDQTITVKFQESATTVSSDFSDITGITTGAVTSTAHTAAGVAEYNGHVAKRYVRAHAQAAGTGPTFAVTAVVIPAQRQA
jgi:hypothetical protein